MICVKIEMWPHGDESRKREIGRTYIANVGGTANRGDYIAAVCRRGTTEVPREIYQGTKDAQPAATRSSSVRDYPRLAYNVWRLVLRALKGAFPEET